MGPNMKASFIFFKQDVPVQVDPIALTHRSSRLIILKISVVCVNVDIGL